MANRHEKNLVEILEENHPIDINKYTNYVHSSQCGAIATFYGNTRDSFDGKTVVELRYEAYVTMAIHCLNSICSSARSLWNLNAIVVAHRVGPVAVGETSVFVAISSVHRADALDACKFVIDEIKASVPIWKKEVYSNGEVWNENFEFFERRLELGKTGDGAHLKRFCCYPKVKGKGDETVGHEDDEGEDDVVLDARPSGTAPVDPGQSSRPSTSRPPPSRSSGSKTSSSMNSNEYEDLCARIEDLSTRELEHHESVNSRLDEIARLQNLILERLS